MTVAWGVIIHVMGTHNSESYGYDDAKTERYRSQVRRSQSMIIQRTVAGDRRTRSSYGVGRKALNSSLEYAGAAYAFALESG